MSDPNTVTPVPLLLCAVVPLLWHSLMHVHFLYHLHHHCQSLGCSQLLALLLSLPTSFRVFLHYPTTHPNYHLVLLRMVLMPTNVLPYQGHIHANYAPNHSVFTMTPESWLILTIMTCHSLKSSISLALSHPQSS